MRAILILLLIIFQGYLRRSRYQGVTPAIRYDQRDVKISLRVAISCSVIWILTSCMFAFRQNNPFIFGLSLNLTDLLDLFLFAGMGIGLCGALFGWGVVLNGSYYIKRLKHYGYNIPQKKSDYPQGLRSLPCENVDRSVSEGWSSESVALAAFAWLAGGIVSLIAAHIYTKYASLVKGLAEIGIAMMLLPVVCWIICGFVFWRQRTRRKYRDDVELDEEEGPQRKVRANLMEGISEIIIYIYLTILYVILVYTMLHMYYEFLFTSGGV